MAVMMVEKMAKMMDTKKVAKRVAMLEVEKASVWGMRSESIMEPLMDKWKVLTMANC
jgi:hypothetical protein